MPKIQVRSSQHNVHDQKWSAAYEMLLLRAQIWLQEFAWTQKDHSRKVAQRRMQWGHSFQLRTAPMFCFETAIRLFYWSALGRHGWLNS